MRASITLRAGRFLGTVLGAALAASAVAQPPGEVSGVRFDPPGTLSWNSAPGAETYNIYRAPLAELAPGFGGLCHLHAIQGTSVPAPGAPPAGSGFFFLVTAESAAGGEGSAGSAATGQQRVPRGACTPVMRAHVLDRLGYGRDEWSAARIAALGLRGYIDEQLSPGSIDESGNAALATRLAAVEPPADINDLIAGQVIRAVYARRQLEQQATTFWTNHFNTDWAKIAMLYQGAFPSCDTMLPQCDPAYPARAYLEASLAQQREMERFRSLAFQGTFREILEASAKSAAMIIYLDTIGSRAPVANENYARELMELHAMGVDAFTQADVENLARVFTGWTLCKKALADLDDPLAPCHTYYLPDPPGAIVATFYVAWHDCGPKTLFAGTPQQVNIPSTCGNPTAGVNDATLALDAIASHPATKRFISGKILQRFVTDQPTPPMIDALVAAWDDPVNPRGAGDLREVLRAALALPEFLDPGRVRSKIKTPLEHYASAARAIRGTTNGRGYMLSYLSNAQHLPHLNPVPTGYPEIGSRWIDTTNILTRQNFGLHLAAWGPGDFGSDPIGLLQANGISTAPGNQVAIIDFLNLHLFAGRLSDADRQAALFYLTTDNFGLPSSFDDYKVRKTVGVMLGFGPFMEQ